MRQELESVLTVARTLPSEQLPAFIGQLAEIQAVVLQRLTSNVPVEASADRTGEDVLDVEQAAVYLNMSAKWIYRHSSILPHVRIGFGARPRLKFRRRDLDGWLERRRINKHR